MQWSFDPRQRTVFVTGAGVSAASGLPTYRGTGGLYEGADLADLPIHASSPTDAVWEFYAPFLTMIGDAEPNEAHLAIARGQRQASAAGGSVTVVTQNVDGLHQAGGARDVLEVHGSLHRCRCTSCGSVTDRGDATAAPTCPRCGSPMRFDAVLFGEQRPIAVEAAAVGAIREADVVVVVGCSGQVNTAQKLLSRAYDAQRYLFAKDVWSPRDLEFIGDFEDVVLGDAAIELPKRIPDDA